LVRDLGGRPGDVASVLVGTGPGSYTGLRVGIATAIGIVRGTRARVRGVPSGETLVFGELEPAQEACVLLDARAGDLYFAHYRREADEVHVLRAPCVLRPEEVLGALPAAGPIFGDASAFEAAGLPSSTVARVRMDVTPRAAALLALGSGRLDRLGGQQPSDIQPLYLRAFAVRARRR
jgi:tRNA threonylcarbamoyladenosine biosynthesis protein TsaB